MAVTAHRQRHFFLFYKVNTIHQVLLSTASRIPRAVSAPPDPQHDSERQTENQTCPVNSCFCTEVVVGYLWVSLPWQSVLGITSLWLSPSERGVSGEAERQPWPQRARRADARWAGAVGEEGRAAEQQRGEGRNPVGCSSSEAALWRQLFRGERSSLPRAYARTLAQHRQEAAGFLRFLNSYGFTNTRM